MSDYDEARCARADNRFKRSTFDFKRDRLVFLNVGVIHGVRYVTMYARIGRSLFSDDGIAHSYLALGIKDRDSTREDAFRRVNWSSGRRPSREPFVSTASR